MLFVVCLARLNYTFFQPDASADGRLTELAPDLIHFFMLSLISLLLFWLYPFHSRRGPGIVPQEAPFSLKAGAISPHFSLSAEYFISSSEYHFHSRGGSAPCAADEVTVCLPTAGGLFDQAMQIRIMIVKKK